MTSKLTHTYHQIMAGIRVGKTERIDLDNTPRYQLLEDFVVSAYLLEAECYQQAYPSIPSDNGWNQGR